jgi:excinuclease ABC subunit A
MARPNVDLLSGIPPTVAIEQRLSQGGKKSTVATVTEIYHYLRLLYAKVGKQHCVQCGRQIRSLSRSQIFDRIGRSYRGKEVMILSPIVRGRKGFHKEVIAGARRLGYRRARIDGELLDLRSPHLTQGLERFKEHDIDIVIGKAKAGGRDVETLVDQGLRIGNGVIHLISERGEQVFNQRLFCLRCGIGYEPLDPRLFSFNSRQGACAECGGMGFQWDFDPELLFADPRKSVSESLGNISALASENGLSLRHSLDRLLEELPEQHGVDIDKPFGRLAKKTQDQVLYGGHGRSGFVGVIPYLRELSQQGE